MGKRFIPLLCGLLLVLLIARPVDAHANLVKSDPPAGALLQTAPKEMVLEFSEELDPSFSRVQLLNSKNQVINAGPGVIDTATPTVMRLALGDLPPHPGGVLDVKYPHAAPLGPSSMTFSRGLGQAPQMPSHKPGQAYTAVRSLDTFVDRRPPGRPGLYLVPRSFYG